MSHLSIYKLMLKNIDRNLLITAIKCLAKELGLEVANDLKLGFHNYDIAIKGQNLPNGISFRTTHDGSVEIVGDSWQQEEAYNRIKQLALPYISAYKAAQFSKNKNHGSAKIQIQGNNVLMATEWDE